MKPIQRQHGFLMVALAVFMGLAAYAVAVTVHTHDIVLHEKQGSKTVSEKNVGEMVDFNILSNDVIHKASTISTRMPVKEGEEPRIVTTEVQGVVDAPVGLPVRKVVREHDSKTYRMLCVGKGNKDCYLLADKKYR